MRWDAQRLDAEDPATLPGMPTMRGLLRSVQVPEFPGLTFHEVRSRSALNEVPAGSAVHQRVRRLVQRGVIAGYAARVSYEALELPLTAFVAIRPFDPSQPDDAPERLAHLAEIDSCYSVAGEDFYLLLVRVASPADLERLLQEIRTAANVTTRTTVVLSTSYEDRPPL